MRSIFELLAVDLTYKIVASNTIFHLVYILRPLKNGRSVPPPVLAALLDGAGRVHRAGYSKGGHLYRVNEEEKEKASHLRIICLIWRKGRMPRSTSSSINRSTAKRDASTTEGQSCSRHSSTMQHRDLFTTQHADLLPTPKPTSSTSAHSH
ncbi:hypothetical protein RND81_14G155700 [Saponaria officinalis]|uniref:Uncharacterized protein n=1 Tax=Saponaria officinalis TaxID=3572 RepID=A0AAW1GQB1_SAPOF